MAPVELPKVRASDLPFRHETPLVDGVKTVTVLRKANDTDSKVLKTTTEVRVHQRAVRVHKDVLLRRALPKFGDAKRSAAEEAKTLSYGEPQVLDLTPKLRITDKKEEKPKDDTSKKQSIVVCRACGMTGDHFTLKCPFKDKAGLDVAKLDAKEPPKEEQSSSSGRYVPPGRRDGASDREKSGNYRERDESTTVRVTNISDHADENELRDLFGQYGMIQKLALPRHQMSGNCKGFAFISYTDKRDAAQAIAKLNGYGYNHLILKVEWSKPELQ